MSARDDTTSRSAAADRDDDTLARRQIESALDVTMVVEAAAGTGKTTALVGRMLALLREGRARLSQMVALTFTDKAAGEMKLRLRGELERARLGTRDSAVRARLTHALSELETAHISTIHGFCTDLLRERPLEAGIDPSFEVLAEDAERRLTERAFDGFFASVLESPPPGVRRLLRRAAGRGNPAEALRSASATLIAQRDFDAPYSRPAFDRCAAIDRALSRLAQLGMQARGCRNPRDPLCADLLELHHFTQALQAEETLEERDYDRLEPQLSELLRRRIWKRKGDARNWPGEVVRQEVLLARDALREELEQLDACLQGELAALLREELRPVVERYRALTAEVGGLDFLDLLSHTRDLLRDDDAVRAALQARFSHVFVDEFQDTDPLQAEILLMLVADEHAGPGPRAWNTLEDARVSAGKLFVVGDPKQAIYAFRRADLTLYTRIRDTLARQGALQLSLTRSFRANHELQSAINASFERVMAEPGHAGPASQAVYQPLRPVRRARDDQPALIALPVPEPYSAYGNLQNAAIAHSTADAVAALIAQLTDRDSGFLVQEDAGWVPLRARHVCLLFRKIRSFGQETPRPYVRALEARRIPHVLLGGRSFHAREEVLALRTALSAIERPDDELSIFATLRGPLLSCSDDALLTLRARLRRLHPLRRIERAGLSATEREVADALELLRELHLRRNRRPIAATIHALLAATRAHAAIAIWPTGEQSLANVLRLAQDATRFEARGATSFRAFVEQLEQDAARGETGEAPVIEEGTEGVRIMTVHRAKGLEFPVVVLCDPTLSRAPRQPSRYLDAEGGLLAVRLAGCAPYELHRHRETLCEREAEEEVRIAYVAATRARDLLVVPAVGDEPRPGWVDVLHPALYPTPESRRSPVPAAGCPAFGHDSVLVRPARARATPDESVAPGQHRPLCGEHRVVWWDPAVLRLGAQPRGGLRQHELLVESSDKRAEQAGAESHARWRAFLEGALAAGSAPSRRARSVTALSAELALATQAAPSHEVEVHAVAGRDPTRPRGARFGTLVHALLADVLSAPGTSLSGLARLHARLLGATDAEREAAAAAAVAALDCELLQDARRSHELRVEVPLALMRDGELIEGVADLAFRTQDAWRVVDFKTALDPGGDARYLAQLALYAEAIERATSLPCRAALLAV